MTFRRRHVTIIKCKFERYICNSDKLHRINEAGINKIMEKFK